MLTVPPKLLATGLNEVSWLVARSTAAIWFLSAPFIWFRLPPKIILLPVLANEKTLLLDGVYSDFEMFDNVAVPSTVVINNKLNNQKITIDYRKISVNENLQNLKSEIAKDVVVKIW